MSVFVVEIKAFQFYFYNFLLIIKEIEYLLPK